MQNHRKINGWDWFDYDELESTNDLALELSARPDITKAVITAVRQTKGRGRTGRTWVSIEGNLFMSLLLKFELKDNAALVFMVSLALLEVIKKISPTADVKLKWPNDVLVNNKKVSGILLEKGEADFIIVGIGVNLVAAPNTPDLLYPAICLQEVGINIDRSKLLIKYLNCFDKLYQQWYNKGYEAIAGQWIKNAKGVGEAIAIRTPKEIIKGRFVGIDYSGRILLNKDDNIEAISAGDVFFE